MRKCKACEIDFSKLNKKKTDFHFPKDIPVSDEMKTIVTLMRAEKKHETNRHSVR